MTKAFHVPEINLWMDETTYLRVTELLDHAAGLVGDGEGRELGLNEEYERGQAELICRSTGLDDVFRDDVIRAIHATARDTNGGTP